MNSGKIKKLIVRCTNNKGGIEVNSGRLFEVSNNQTLLLISFSRVLETAAFGIKAGETVAVVSRRWVYSERPELLIKLQA